MKCFSFFSGLTPQKKDIYYHALTKEEKKCATQKKKENRKMADPKRRPSDEGEPCGFIFVVCVALLVWCACIYWSQTDEGIEATKNFELEKARTQHVLDVMFPTTHDDFIENVPKTHESGPIHAWVTAYFQKKTLVLTADILLNMLLVQINRDDEHDKRITRNNPKIYNVVTTTEEEENVDSVMINDLFKDAMDALTSGVPPNMAYKTGKPKIMDEILPETTSVDFVYENDERGFIRLKFISENMHDFLHTLDYEVSDNQRRRAFRWVEGVTKLLVDNPDFSTFITIQRIKLTDSKYLIKIGGWFLGFFGLDPDDKVDLSEGDDTSMAGYFRSYVYEQDKLMWVVRFSHYFSGYHLDEQDRIYPRYGKKIEKQTGRYNHKNTIGSLLLL